MREKPPPAPDLPPGLLVLHWLKVVAGGSGESSAKEGGWTPCAPGGRRANLRHGPLLASPPPLLPSSPALGCYAVSMAAASSDPTFTHHLEPIKVKSWGEGEGVAMRGGGGSRESNLIRREEVRSAKVAARLPKLRFCLFPLPSGAEPRAWGARTRAALVKTRPLPPHPEGPAGACGRPSLISSSPAPSSPPGRPLPRLSHHVWPSLCWVLPLIIFFSTVTLDQRARKVLENADCTVAGAMEENRGGTHGNRGEYGQAKNVLFPGILEKPNSAADGLFIPQNEYVFAECLLCDASGPCSEYRCMCCVCTHTQT